MRKFRVGLLTFSDGREYLHKAHLATNLRHQNREKTEIEATGEAQVIDGQAVIWDSATARQEVERLQQAGVDLVISNYAIWCYPHLSAIAATLLHRPILLFSNLHPSEPGMVAMLARKEGRYWLAIVPGRIVEFDRESALARGWTVTPQWPIAFTKLDCGADEFLSRFPCNHIHGVDGDCTKESLAAGKILGIETHIFGSIAEDAE